MKTLKLLRQSITREDLTLNRIWTLAPISPVLLSTSDKRFDLLKRANKNEFEIGMRYA